MTRLWPVPRSLRQHEPKIRLHTAAERDKNAKTADRRTHARYASSKQAMSESLKISLIDVRYCDSVWCVFFTSSLQ